MNVLKLDQVKLRIGHAEILRGVNLELNAGERLALIGPNGAGKSSLFNVISGRQRCSSGQIYLREKSIVGLTPHKIIRHGLSRSFQSSNLFSALSVFDNLCCAAMWKAGSAYTFWRRLSRQRRVIETAERILTLLDLQQRRSDLAGTLTYAEQKTLEIGMSVAGDANCILLDEPTAGMNRTETNKMMTLIRQISAGRSLLMVEHDMQVVFALADRIAVMVQGQIIACDTPERIRSNPQVQAAYLSDWTAT
ncbi:ABC transporter ATP-binding protein [Undibacterium flavidum]|uniref:ABC transporter ATP-binding protein n=1 Tax=Undibacterium flavidum TaxID=2762297 RepID=A0ABR6YFV5_9BURK|nr:ABC transporter ATP-binding protein [Undibacterium flavidum]MBC3875427.1 ABC transporter ATP-binding protein [Undibacterium flavidum]